MVQQQGLNKPNYRPDIDGLRAVAVLMVVLFHLKFPLLTGGFIGVDIFFVISGYLITGIIHRELEQGSFTFKRFYERRVRRIAPALVPVLTFSTVATYVFFTPRELIHYAYSLIAAIFSWSNIYFWTQSDYFSQDYGKILLHTWSLSVEEQFYIALPITLYLLHKKTRTLTPFLVLAAMASFGIAEWMVLTHNLAGAFYMPYARAWELLVGSIVAVAPEIRDLKRLVRELLAFAAICMIAVGGFWLTEHSPFPGASALLPCVGAALLIITGRQGTFVSRILSWRPIAFIGLISYSVYLWHWPLIILANRGAAMGLTFQRSEGKVLLLALSLILGWLSWAVVEQPFRTGMLKRLPRPRLFALAGVAGAALAVVAIAFAGKSGFPNRFPKRAVDVAAYADPDTRTGNQVGICQISGRAAFKDYRQDLCVAPSPNKRNILLIGDSHAGALWWGLEHSLPNDHIMEATVTYGCIFTVGSYDDSACGQTRNFIYESFLPTHRVDAVVLIERWNDKVNASKFMPTFAWFQQHGITLIVVGPGPEYDAPLPLLLAMSIKMNAPEFPVKHRLSGPAQQDADLQKRAESGHYQYLSAYQAICPNGACRLFADQGEDVPILRDTDHLSNDGATWLVKKWADENMLR